MSEPSHETSECAAAVVSDPMVAVALVDQLVTAATDLERLQSLLADATEQLLGSFVACEQLLDAGESSGPPHLDEARRHLRAAITAMQFPDMASQILTHAVRRIQGVSDRLSAIDGDEVVVDLVDRACPVGQHEMDAGSIELF